MTTEQKLSLFNKRQRIQILASMTEHIMTLAHGVGLGWLSPTLNILQSPATPLNFAVTTDAASWIGSNFGLGFIAGNVFFGLTLNRLGRKANLYLLAFPHMFFWILNYFVRSVEYLYVARLCAGLASAGIFLVVPIYISEISDSHIRGALTAMAMMFFSSGLLIGFIMSTYLDYYLIPCIVVVLPIIYLVGNLFFPETPQCLLKRGQTEKAHLSFNFYKNIENDVALEPIPKQAPGKTIRHSEFDELKASIEKSGLAAKLTFTDFFNKSTMFNFLTAVVLCFLNQLSGSFAIINYMANIFAASGPTLDPNVCAIVMGAVQILGSLSATMLVERFGRRPLLLSSTFGMMAGMYGFGAFVQFTDAETKAIYNWVPIAFMMLVVFTASYGVFGIFFTIVVEIHQAKIRPQALSICMLFNSVLVFLVLKLYPYFLFNLGITITMYSCASVCVVAGSYMYMFLPETKGKSMEND